MSIVPGWQPMNEDQLKLILRAMGGPNETMEQCLNGFNQMTEEVIQRGVRVIGMRQTYVSPTTRH